MVVDKNGVELGYGDWILYTNTAHETVLAKIIRIVIAKSVRIVVVMCSKYYTQNVALKNVAKIERISTQVAQEEYSYQYEKLKNKW